MKPSKEKKRRLSRRDFVKGTTVGAGAAALAGLSPVPATAENRNESAQQPSHDCDIAAVGLGISGEAIEKATGGTAPEALAILYCTHAPRLYKWFQDHSIEIQQLGEGPSMVLPPKKTPWASRPWKEVSRLGAP